MKCFDLGLEESASGSSPEALCSDHTDEALVSAHYGVVEVAGSCVRRKVIHCRPALSAPNPKKYGGAGGVGGFVCGGANTYRRPV